MDHKTFKLKQRLKKLEREIKTLDRDRKLYKVQSEWHKLIYPLVLERETVEDIIFNEEL